MDSRCGQSFILTIGHALVDPNTTLNSLYSEETTTALRETKKCKTAGVSSSEPQSVRKPLSDTQPIWKTEKHVPASYSGFQHAEGTQRTRFCGDRRKNPRHFPNSHLAADGRSQWLNLQSVVEGVCLRKRKTTHPPQYDT